MTQNIPPDTVAEARRRSELSRWITVVTDFLRRHPLGTVGAAIIVLMILCAIGAPMIAPYDPLKTNFSVLLSPPSADYWLGTDVFGRDLLSRLIYGSRTALLVGLTAAFVGTTLGAFIGVASAYFGGQIDMVSQRIVDIFLSFPIIMVALAASSVLTTLRMEDVNDTANKLVMVIM